MAKFVLWKSSDVHSEEAELIGLLGSNNTDVVVLNLHMGKNLDSACISLTCKSYEGIPALSSG